MAESRELQLVLKMQDEISGKLDSLNKGLDKSSKTANSTGQSFSKLANTFAAVLSVGAIVNFAKSSVQAASDQQVANEKLANALGNVKGARQGDYEALQAQASALQMVTRFADEQIVNSQALLATFQLNGEAIGQLTPRILDMVEANAQLGTETIDLQGATLAIGKAMTNGIGVLGRYGVAFTEAQKDAFELGNQEDKLTILTQVLDDNFKNAAETVGKTFAGRVAIAKNAIGDFKENIGFALMPTLEMLLGIVTQNTNSLNTFSKQTVGNTGTIEKNGVQVSDTMERFNQWGKAIYQITNMLIVVGKSISLAVTALIYFASNLVDVAKIQYSFVKDGIENFTKFGTNMKAIFSAIGEAMKGNFDDAKKELKNVFNSTLSNSTKAWNGMLLNQQTFGIAFKDQAASIGDSMLKAIDGAGYTPVTEAAVKAYRAMTDGAATTGGAVGDKMKELAEEISKLDDKYKDLSTEAGDALFELKSKHEETLKSFRDEIDKVTASIADLNKAYADQRTQDTQDVASQIVEAEQRMAEIQKELAGDVSQERRDELNKELTSLQATYRQYAEFIKTIDKEVIEARRVAGLNDLARAIEEFNRRRALAKQEYDAKLLELNNEIIAIQLKEAEEKALYEDKVLFITTKMAELLATHQATMAKNLKITKDEVAAEMKLYQDLLALINRVRSASSGAAMSYATGNQSSVNDAIISPNGNIITTHPDDYLIATKNPNKLMGGGGINIVINGDVTGEEIIKKVEEGIMRKWKFNQKLAT